MYQVRIFSGSEDDTATLERQINDWLWDTGVRVVQVFGNMSPQAVVRGEEKSTPIPGAASDSKRARFAPSDLVIVVLYEDLRARRH